MSCACACGNTPPDLLYFPAGTAARFRQLVNTVGTDPVVPQDLTGVEVVVYLKRSLTLADDATGNVALTVANGGIVIIDAPAGLYDIVFLPATTAVLSPSNTWYVVPRLTLEATDIQIPRSATLRLRLDALPPGDNILCGALLIRGETTTAETGPVPFDPPPLPPYATQAYVDAGDATTLAAAQDFTDDAVTEEAQERGAADDVLALALQDHIDDPTAAHAASAISFAPGGGISSTTTQGAIAELDAEKASLSGATFTGGISAPSVSTDSLVSPSGALEISSSSPGLGTITIGVPFGASVTYAYAALTDDRLYAFPDASGTIALTADITTHNDDTSAHGQTATGRAVVTAADAAALRNAAGANAGVFPASMLALGRSETILALTLLNSGLRTYTFEGGTTVTTGAGTGSLNSGMGYRLNVTNATAGSIVRRNGITNSIYGMGHLGTGQMMGVNWGKPWGFSARFAPSQTWAAGNRGLICVMKDRTQGFGQVGANAFFFIECDNLALTVGYWNGSTTTRTTTLKTMVANEVVEIIMLCDGAGSLGVFLNGALAATVTGVPTTNPTDELNFTQELENTGGGQGAWWNVAYPIKFWSHN